MSKTNAGRSKAALQSTGGATPYTGNDLQMVRQKMGLSVGDFTWMLGINMSHWGQCSNDGNAPIPEAPIALLAQFIDRHPELSLVPHPLEPARVYSFFSLGLPLTLKEFGLAFGRDGSAGHRWVSSGKDTPASLQRSMYMLVRLAEMRLNRDMDSCIEDGVNERSKAIIAEVWSEWRTLAESEARSRGCQNLWTSRGWPKTNKQGESDGEAAEWEPPEVEVTGGNEEE